MNFYQAAILADVKGRIDTFKTQLPSKVDVNQLRGLSKLPRKALLVCVPLLYRMVDLSDAASRLYEGNMMVSAITLTRSTLETVAMLYWLHKKIDEAVQSGEVAEELDTLLTRALAGIKGGEPAEPINVLTYLDHLDKEFEGTRELYEHLSEFAHPNYFGVGSLYGKFDTESGCLNLQWPEWGSQATSGISLLFIGVLLFEIYYDKVLSILPDFDEVCDRNLL